jgi:hypothetical protein
MEVFLQAEILFCRYWHNRINRLRKVLMKHLFPGCSIVALEHVFKLHERVGPVKVTFLGFLVKLRDGLINSELDTILAIILIDFYSTFIVSFAALKLVDFRQAGVTIVPGLQDLIQGHLLVDQGHIVRRCVALVFS